VAPVAFSLGPVVVWSYPLLLLAAFLTAWLVARRAGPSRGVSRAKATDLVLAAALGGILGARALYVATHFGEFAEHPFRALMLQTGGLTFFGGLAGGALAVALVARAERLSAGGVADTAALALPLASAVGRLGCFAAGCCGGLPAAGPFGVTFPGGSGPVWPTQLLDAAAQVALFGVLVALARVVPARRGALLWAYLALYPAVRFVVEVFRAEPRVVLGLTQAQLVSAMLVPVGVAGFVWTSMRARGDAGA
jgi:phosphatidylglycerol:prolipoprotein diacylglycerol transferase